MSNRSLPEPARSVGETSSNATANPRRAAPCAVIVHTSSSVLSPSISRRVSSPAPPCSVIGPASVLEILRADAAAFILPDTHIAGGILPCVTIGRICEAAGIPCIMHCGHDLGPKTAAMLHVAAACPAYSLANDTTYYGLEDDIITERFSIERGTITVPTKPGLGIEGDPERLARYKIDC